MKIILDLEDISGVDYFILINRLTSIDQIKKIIEIPVTTTNNENTNRLDFIYSVLFGNRKSSFIIGKKAGTKAKQNIKQQKEI